jgi:hypothetical protein
MSFDASKQPAGNIPKITVCLIDDIDATGQKNKIAISQTTRADIYGSGKLPFFTANRRLYNFCGFTNDSSC